MKEAPSGDIILMELPLITVYKQWLKTFQTDIRLTSFLY